MSRRSRPLVLLPWIAFVVLAVSASAQAQSAPPFDLALAGCPNIDATRLRELITVELGTVGALAAPRATTIQLTCAGERVTIALTDTLTGSNARADVELSTTPPPARPRVLALTVTEFVALTWADLRTPAPVAASRSVNPPASPAGPAPLPPSIAVVAEPPTSSPSRVRLFALGSLRRMGQPATWLVGAGIGGDVNLTPHLALAADVIAETGQTTTTLAAIDWRSVAGTAGLALGAGRGRFWADVVPAFTVGVVRLAAAPTVADATGAALTRAWAGPALTTRLRYSFGTRAYVQVHVGAGLVTRSVVGLVNDSGPLVTIQGFWGSAGIAAGMVL